MNRYIVIKDNKILRKYHTKEDISSIHNIMKKYNVTDYEIREIPEDNEYRPDFNINEFENHKLKSEEQRIIEGFVPVPKGFKIDKGKLIEKTIWEKIKDSDIILQSNEYYCDEENIIKIEIQIPTQEEINEKLIQQEIRQIAIERLQTRGEI